MSLPAWPERRPDACASPSATVRYGWSTSRGTPSTQARLHRPSLTPSPRPQPTPPLVASRDDGVDAGREAWHRTRPPRRTLRTVTPAPTMDPAAGRMRVIVIRAPASRDGVERPMNRKQTGPEPLVAVPGQLKCVLGGVLLSRTLAGAVPSALSGLASGFGMGPGVSLSL